jgi:antitoxin MazE
MATVISGRVVEIGNSQGIRIPKLLLEQSGIKKNVKIEVRDGQISIFPAERVREGWSEAFAAATTDDLALDDVTGTAWDEKEWEW